jgi:hypothetical protein
MCVQHCRGRVVRRCFAAPLKARTSWGTHTHTPSGSSAWPGKHVGRASTWLQKAIRKALPGRMSPPGCWSSPDSALGPPSCTASGARCDCCRGALVLSAPPPAPSASLASESTSRRFDRCWGATVLRMASLAPAGVRQAGRMAGGQGVRTGRVGEAGQWSYCVAAAAINSCLCEHVSQTRLGCQGEHGPVQLSQAHLNYFKIYSPPLAGACSS